MYRSIICLVLTVFLTRLEIECFLTRRYNYDAVLYEAYSIDSKSVQFSRTNKNGWKDLNALSIANGLITNSMVCTRGHGAWFAFPKENFKASGLKYSLIIGENCLPSKMIYSMAPVGEMKKRMDDAVVLFSETNFGGDQQTLLRSSTSMDAKSLVLFGDKDCLIEGGGEKVCLIATKDEDLCILSNLDSTLGKTGSKTITINADCSNMNDAKILYVETCYDKGVHDMKIDEDMSPMNLQNLCKGDVPQPVKNDLSLIMEIFDARIRRSFQEREAITMPPEANFKVIMLADIFDIFQATCSVDDEYLGIVRILFFMRMREVWKKNPESIGSEDEKWKDMLSFLRACKVNAEAGVMRSIGETACGYNLMPRTEEEDDALNEMQESDQFDFVIDQIWLIFNFVTPYCNNINNFDDNKWAEMTTFLKRFFMVPIEEQWRSKRWNQMYPTMFHGFDFENERKKLVTCVQGILKISPETDTVRRSSWIREEISEEVEHAPGRRRVSAAST